MNEVFLGMECEFGVTGRQLSLLLGKSLHHLLMLAHDLSVTTQASIIGRSSDRRQLCDDVENLLIAC